MPISKSYLFYVEAHADVLQIVVENQRDTREPTNHSSDYLFTESRRFCEDLIPFIKHTDLPENWLSSWQQLEQIAMKELKQAETTELTRSEERRVGKESRARMEKASEKKKVKDER